MDRLQLPLISNVKFMGWLRTAAIKFWKGTGNEVPNTRPMRIVPSFPKILRIPLAREARSVYESAKVKCYACEAEHPIAMLLDRAIFFCFHPVQRTEVDGFIPLITFDCPRCRAREYLALFSDYVEVGTFGAAPTIDLILDSVVLTTVKFELLNESKVDEIESEKFKYIPWIEEVYVHS